MTQFTIMELRRGLVSPLGKEGHVSAIDKHPCDDEIFVGPEGLDGDEQADLHHHGGRDKALHAYSSAHYQRWAEELPHLQDFFVPGRFGENLVVHGVTERDLCLGDRFQIGRVIVELSQSRQPCWKLNLRFSCADMARRVQATGRTGWYFRVIQPGLIGAGRTALLAARPNPGWSLARVSDLLYQPRIDAVALAEFAALPNLPERWLRLAERRLRHNCIEDWSQRLNTPGEQDIHPKHETG